MAGAGVAGAAGAGSWINRSSRFRRWLDPLVIYGFNAGISSKALGPAIDLSGNENSPFDVNRAQWSCGCHGWRERNNGAIYTSTCSRSPRKVRDSTAPFRRYTTDISEHFFSSRTQRTSPSESHSCDPEGYWRLPPGQE